MEKISFMIYETKDKVLIVITFFPQRTFSILSKLGFKSD